MTIHNADPKSLDGWDPSRDLGFPGSFPYTRGIQPTMYRGRLWTMRQYAGFGTAAESNQRYRYLLSQGVSGLSVAFDLPTQMGYDSDHQLAAGEVGRVGVAIDSIEDMAELVDGIPLDRVSISMTINATAIILLALYVAVARRQGVALTALSGTVQNDILKEYVARGTYIYPPRQSLRLVTDIFAFCERELPQWNTISISGYHIREAGRPQSRKSPSLSPMRSHTCSRRSTPDSTSSASASVCHSFSTPTTIFWRKSPSFAPPGGCGRESCAIALAPRHPRAQQLRFHTQTAGSTLTAQQPDNNIVRVAIQALAAVLGGTQSLHCNGRDEALALPTEEAARIALRTQQIIAAETGVAKHRRSAWRLVRDRVAHQSRSNTARARSSSESRRPEARCRRSSRGSSSARFRNPRIARNSRSTPAKPSSSASMRSLPRALPASTS